MENRYNRNRFYLSNEEQEIIKQTNILFGGAGIGSIIAESALRMGFESITIVDGDKVEESNLNRQNYNFSDIGTYKAEALAKRLLAINPDAKIKYLNTYIDHNNVEQIIEGHDIAINALDFKSDIPFVFDKICKYNNIPVLHPYNFGWGGFLTIASPTGFPLSGLSSEPLGFEFEMLKHAVNYSKFWNIPINWLENVMEQYNHEEQNLPFPQLAIGSWIAAGFCVNAMFDLATNRKVMYFPKFYISSFLDGEH